tara:strand:+ start:1016 stop:1861 length:846 start_codon:yes stop_codon:yes gene_type:complete
VRFHRDRVLNVYRPRSRLNDFKSRPPRVFRDVDAVWLLNSPRSLVSSLTIPRLLLSAPPCSSPQAVSPVIEPARVLRGSSSDEVVSPVPEPTRVLHTSPSDVSPVPFAFGVVMTRVAPAPEKGRDVPPNITEKESWTEGTASPSVTDSIPLTPTQHVMVYGAVFVPIACFLWIYSAMGEGVYVFTQLSKDGNYEVAWWLCVAAVGWLALLWVVDAFDKSITGTSAKNAVYVLTIIPLGAMFVASLLAVEHYISAPMVLFVVFKGTALRLSQIRHALFYRSW